MGEPEIVRIVQGVGVDVVILVDMVDVIYEDGMNSVVGGMSFEKFVDLILNMRGKNTATVQDIKQQQRHIKVMMDDSVHRVKAAVQEEAGRLRTDLQELREVVKQGLDSSDSELE